MPNVVSHRTDQIRADASFDVVVVGGGVNGIGVFRELALQGLRVLLVERGDFASGCSAAPSRMIHGGLRYLENGEFDLVRESLRERDALLLNAPHMVRPLPTMIPISGVFSGLLNSAARFLGRTGQPSSRGAVPIKFGLMLYDWVTRRRRILPRHKFRLRGATRRLWPDLTPTTNFSAVYHDAWIVHPERLCLEMIADTVANAPQCVALNYAEIAAAEGGFHVTCQRSGESVQIRARAVVNATGAWLDETVETLGNTSAETMVSGTKGSHLILDHPALLEALGGHMVYFENADGRVCIVFPYQGHVLAGSTDIRVKKAGRVQCTPEERDYIFDSLKLVFPEITLSAENVVFSYAGIRPLPQSGHDFTGRISRGHYIKKLIGAVPQFCMVGGKWTTFRAFAESTADEVLAELGQKRLCDTLAMPIGGGKDFPTDAGILIADLTDKFHMSEARARHLVGHYGTAAEAVQDICDATAGEDQSLGEGVEYTRAEIAHLVRSEMVLTLSDVVLRRTALAITGAISAELIETIAEIVAGELSLSSQDITDQKTTLIAELADYYGLASEVLTLRSELRRKECV